jgi:hypothetical protein
MGATVFAALLVLSVYYFGQRQRSSENVATVVVEPNSSDDEKPVIPPAPDAAPKREIVRRPTAGIAVARTAKRRNERQQDVEMQKATDGLMVAFQITSAKLSEAREAVWEGLSHSRRTR